MYLIDSRRHFSCGAAVVPVSATTRCIGPDSAENCTVSAGAFLEQVGLPVVLQRQVFCSRQCSTLFGGAVPGQGLHARRVATTGVLVQTVQHTVWKYTGAVPGQG